MSRKRLKTIDAVIDCIKKAGCSGGYDPRYNRHIVKDIPSWDIYLTVRRWRSELCAIAYTKHLFTQPKPISPIKYNPEVSPKCSYCTAMGRDRCPFGDSQDIPAATFKKGCEHWKENKSVYF